MCRSPRLLLFSAANGSFDYGLLKLRRQARKVFRVAADSDDQIRITLGVLTRFQQFFMIDTGDLHLHATLSEVALGERTQCLFDIRCVHSDVQNRCAEKLLLTESGGTVEHGGDTARVVAVNGTNGIAQRRSRTSAVWGGSNGTTCVRVGGKLNG